MTHLEEVKKTYTKTKDYDIVDFYNDFIGKAKREETEFGNKIANYKKQLDRVHDFLTGKQYEINERFDIDITRYTEYNEKKYKAGEPLHQMCRNRIEKMENEFTTDDRMLMLQLIKYCSTLRRMTSAIHRYEFAQAKLKLKTGQYRDLVHNYYNKVHKYLLLGYGYRFRNTKLGVLFIMRTLRDVKKDAFNKIDWAETKKNVKKLKEQGVELYDKAKAEECAKKGIPYNGVDYRVFRKNPVTYRYELRDTDIMLSPFRKILPICTLQNKFRGYKYDQIAELFCKNEEDLFNLDISLYYKLPIYLCKYPEKYVNYVRTPDQRIPFNRKDYRKDR